MVSYHWCPLFREYHVSITFRNFVADLYTSLMTCYRYSPLYSLSNVIIKLPLNDRSIWISLVFRLFLQILNIYYIQILKNIYIPKTKTTMYTILKLHIIWYCIIYNHTIIIVCYLKCVCVRCHFDICNNHYIAWNYVFINVFIKLARSHWLSANLIK
jgi:hypothetical protein